MFVVDPNIVTSGGLQLFVDICICFCPCLTPPHSPVVSGPSKLFSCQRHLSVFQLSIVGQLEVLLHQSAGYLGMTVGVVSIRSDPFRGLYVTLVFLVSEKSTYCVLIIVQILYSPHFTPHRCVFLHPGSYWKSFFNVRSVSGHECFRSWIHQIMSVSGHECFKSWMFQIMSVSGHECFRSWMCQIMSVSYHECVRSWVCQVISVSYPECVRSSVCQFMSVSGQECVRLWVCQVMSVSAHEYFISWVCQVMTVSYHECIGSWVCQIMGVSEHDCVRSYWRFSLHCYILYVLVETTTAVKCGNRLLLEILLL